MTTLTLPGIKKVEFIAADELVLYPKQSLTPGSTTSAIGNFTELPLVELASCNTTKETTAAGTIYTTTVEGIITDGNQLTTSQRHYLQEKYHAFKLSDVYGNKYLIGEDRKPYPEISFSPANDGQPSGSRTIPFQITWKSTLLPIELVIL